MIKTIERIEEVMDFAWELSQNDLYASYPRTDLIVEFKEELEKAINLENHNIIAYYHQNILQGVCFYFWINNEKYVQTTGFLISANYDQVADEFICYINNQLPGYELYIGVPYTNINANYYFKKRNIVCIEDSIVTRIRNLKHHKSKGYDYIGKINISNFEQYIAFHDKHAIPAEMYYNSTNLRKVIDNFRIFVFRHDEEIHGSIFVSANKNISDVVGLFIDEEYKNKGIESILINEMLTHLYNEFGAIREILYFIEQHATDELNIALTAGFEVKERYILYKCIL